MYTVKGFCPYIHLLENFVTGHCCVLGTVLGIWNTSVNKMKISLPQEKCILVGGDYQ